MFYSWIYTSIYLKLFVTIANLKDRIKNFNKNSDSLNSAALISSVTFEKLDLDLQATKLGNEYRGIGVFISILGLLIIFLAIAPIGFKISKNTSMLFSIFEIILMALVAFLVLSTNISERKASWIDTRFQAETLRYVHLNFAIANFNNAQLDISKKKTLFDSLKIIFTDQIKYNSDKKKLYESIEKNSGHIGWIFFLVAFSGAILHLFIHAGWLIFPTVFLPATVGTLHGLNNFLRLSDSAEEHHNILEFLKKSQTALINEVDIDSENLLQIANSTYETLTGRDIKWKESTSKLVLKVG
jgi:hypothetical protein